MNYIFFDIECANCQGGQAKICSFGYVITNEQFEVIEKEDWIINPKAPFMLMGHRNRPYIQLAYDKEQFKSAPSFPRLYDGIKALFKKEDCLIFGYAADNDAGYLKSEFLRYSLPCINFAYYDVQKILRFSIPDAGQNQISLSSAAAMFEEEVDQNIHKSDEDALLTMQVLRGICGKTGLSPLELTEKYPVVRGDLYDNQVLIRALEGKELVVRALGDKSDRIAPKSENRMMYTRFIRHVKPSGAGYPQWLKGKKVSVPEKYAERHFKNIVRLIQLICDCGGRYTLISEECHIFISFPIYNDDGSLKICQEITRMQKKRPSDRPDIQAPLQFLERCGLSEKEFSDLPLPEIRYLLDESYSSPKKSAEKTGSGTRPRRTPPKKEHR